LKIERKITPAGKNLQIALKNLQGKVGKVGWFEKSKYEDGTPVAYVATIQEYGYPAGNIPPRPFMRTTIAEKQQEWKKIAESGSKAILNGKATVGTVMEAIGLKAAGDIRKKISLITAPPLSPRTIEARRSRRADKKTIGLLTKPLIDTGIMFGTLTNTVEDE
jgi:hypothetical protein